MPPAAIADVAPTRRAFPLGQMVLGVAVVVGIVVSMSAWLGRSRRVEALTDRDSVVLTGFSNSTGEPIFDETLRQGLAVGLEQSPFLNIIPDRRIAQILTLMGRTSGEPVSPESAREACARAGGRAAIAGSVNRLGARYVIGLTATNCATGADFAHVQVEAASREVVLTALSTAVTQMRGKLGESLASIEQFDAPLDEVTTASLQALQAYSLGRRTARDKGSPADIPFYKRAIELDPDFAIAHAALGVSYINLGQPSVAAEHLEKAYRLRERVSEREKYRIAAYYHHAFTGELEQARPIYDLWKGNYPRDLAPYLNLGLCHSWLGEYEKAAAVTAEALRLDPGNVLSVPEPGRVPDQAGTPRRGESDPGQGAGSRARQPVHPQQPWIPGVPARRQDCHGAAAGGGPRPAGRRRHPAVAAVGHGKRTFGRLANAREFSRRAAESAKRAGAAEAAAGWLVNAALREAEVGNRAEAQQQLLDALRLATGRDVVALGALASARSGDLARAEGLERDLQRTYPLNTIIQRYLAAHDSRGDRPGPEPGRGRDRGTSAGSAVRTGVAATHRARHALPRSTCAARPTCSRATASVPPRSSRRSSITRASCSTTRSTPSRGSNWAGRGPSPAMSLAPARPTRISSRCGRPPTRTSAS